MQSKSTPKLFDTQGASAYLEENFGIEVAPATLISKRCGGPVFVKVMGKARYEPGALDAWARSKITRHKFCGDADNVAA